MVCVKVSGSHIKTIFVFYWFFFQKSTSCWFKSKKLHHWGPATQGLLFCGFLSYQVWQKSTRGYAILAIILAPVIMAVFPFIMIITKVSQMDFKFKYQLSSLYQCTTIISNNLSLPLCTFQFLQKIVLPGFHMHR